MSSPRRTGIVKQGLGFAESIGPEVFEDGVESSRTVPIVAGSLRFPAEYLRFELGMCADVF